jgi:hypothetical protein
MKNTFEEHIKTLNRQQLNDLHYYLSYDAVYSKSCGEKMQLYRKMNQIAEIWKSS